MVDFGNVLKTLRLRENMTQAQLAQKLGLILSRLVDTFSSRILYPMRLPSGNYSIAVV